MTERLIVRNFAGIQDLEIEVKKINILIGPQASGKSVCAKLLFYFKNFVWKILSTVEKEQGKRDLDFNYSKTFEVYFPADSWGNQDFIVRYEVLNDFIEVRRKQDSKDRVALTYSDFFKKELQKLRGLLKKSKEESLNKSEDYGGVDILLPRVSRGLRIHLIDALSKSLCKEATFKQLFIPAGRSFFANLQSNIFSFISDNNALDPFLKAFGSTYEGIKSVYDKMEYSIVLRGDDEKKIQDEINRLIEETLCGKHIHEKGKDFLKVADGRRINVTHSSSGQQELLPLTIMLYTLPFLATPGSGRAVYIEEPEAHLFPAAQRNIVELIATVFNYREENLQFFITTHSPYVLTSVNNLLQAGLLYNESDQLILQELEKIVPPYKALHASIVSAYVLENGKCSSIICPDTGLIDAKIIDAVSDELAIEFDQLLDLA